MVSQTIFQNNEFTLDLKFKNYIHVLQRHQ